MKILSIIIPIYNVEQYLEQCLNSVLVDNYVDNIEVICVNDGSTDNSLDICEKYVQDYSIVKLITQSNQGLSAARNTGLKNAIGKYVYFLDSDDYLYPGVIQKIIDFLTSNDVDTLCTNVLLDGENLLYEMSTPYVSGSRDKFLSVFYKNVLYPYPVQAWLYVTKRDFILKHQLQFKEGFLHEDEDFTPRLIYYAKRIGLLNIPCQYHRVLRPGAITSNVSEKHITDTLTIVRELTAFFTNSMHVNTLFLSAIFELYMSLIKRMYVFGFQKDFIYSIDGRNITLLAQKTNEIRTSRLIKISPLLASRYYFYNIPKVCRKLINIVYYKATCKPN